MKIICIGRNYVDHIKELNNELPQNMVIFMKPSTAIHKNEEKWSIPSFSQDVHYECEIVLKISKAGKNIPESEASTYFDEITLGIDFTARDIQTRQKEKGLPWEIAKAFDGSAIVGQFYPKSEFNLSEIKFQLSKNGNQVQNGNSTHMIYNFETMISEVSKYFSLEIGDLIYTGTPAGVGPIKSKDILTGYLKDKEVFSLEIN